MTATPPTQAGPQSALRVRDLFDLPEQVRSGDFVVKLTEGIQKPHDTVDTYVVTPALVDAFGRSLGLVGSTLRDGRSQGAYLHGSFGSGKSHFMALLSLLLDDREEAWRRPEFHPLREKHPFVGKTKLLQLHFHMIGKKGLEQAIFTGYIEYVRAHHPEATIPGLFADEQLFSDARRHMDELGEQAFFAPMNKGLPGWGALDAANRWDRARFEACAASTDPELREKLFSVLVKHRYPAFADNSGAFVDVDTGLATVARHAQSLGYDGIVLFLDELILWLSHRASETAWLHNETQKMVKLVEAQASARAIPIVSFIARQRNLAEMVGEQYAGAENVALQQTLKHWEGRYDTIKLEDRNLPAIVEKRVLKKKNDEARKTLEKAFDKLRTQASASGEAFRTLLASEDADGFKKLYPFSPALVEALVALSNSLQRERTAIKILMEILVDHIGDLELGETVRVGDLFDVLAGGEEAADGVMRARFQAAKNIYKYQFLPVIQASHGTDTEARCQRMRPEHPVRLGCSNCREKRCRADNRLVKTLLVAALVPEVPSLKDLTASKLYQLNFGQLKVPIPGTEGQNVVGTLRKWATSVGQLRLGSQADPTVSLGIDGVELKPILDLARDVDSFGARQRAIRDLLFEAMGVERTDGWLVKKKVEWRKTRRGGEVAFGNVRKMSPEQLTCPDDQAFRIVVDYPFDEPGHGPNEDLEACDRYVEERKVGAWTLVWLPSFFSKEVSDLLGEYVILEHVLGSGENKRKYTSHLSIDNQTRALVDLDNLRNQIHVRLLQALDAAYGLNRGREGDLDPSASIDTHLRLLQPGAALQVSFAADLAESIDLYAAAMLDARWPRHPRFAHALTTARVARLVEKFGELVDADDKRIPADRELASEMGGTLGELGLVRVTDGRVFLLEDRLLQDIEQRRRRKGADAPTAAEARRFVDPEGLMGLETAAADLAVRCYARASARTFVLYGKPYEPRPGQDLPDDVVLEKPELPGHAVWSRALEAAGSTFGFTLAGKALHADNLKRFEAKLGECLKQVAGPASRLPALLAQRLAELELPEDSDRLRTARSGEALCAALLGQPVLRQIEVLAEFRPETSPRALGRSLESASRVVASLGNSIYFGVFAQLRARRGELPGAAEVLDRMAEALRKDEMLEAFPDQLELLTKRAQALLVPAVEKGEGSQRPGQVVLARLPIEARGREGAKNALAELVRELEARIDGAGEDLLLQGELVLRGR